MRRRFLLLALPLAGCAATPTRQYTLSPVPGAVRAGVTARIGVRNVFIPGALAASGLPAPAAAGQVVNAPNDLWAAPVAPMLQALMAQDLTQRLPAALVLDENGAIGAPPDLYVEIQVYAFGPDETGLTTLIAQLAVRPAATAATGWQVRSFSASAPGGSTPDGLVAAMSALWGQAADAVAAMV